MAKTKSANGVAVKTKTTWKQAFKRDWQLFQLCRLSRFENGFYGL